MAAAAQYVAAAAALIAASCIIVNATGVIPLSWSDLPQLGAYLVLGLAMFLTFFVMSPVIEDINKNALQPYLGQKISQAVALDRAQKPLRAFMFRQTREKDIAVFYAMTKEPRPAKQDDVPTYILIPAFTISELKTAFEIGFAIYIPFIVIDMVVASVLLSMGMMMIPPVLISLPFKILIFLLVDGWNLTVSALFASFNK